MLNISPLKRSFVKLACVAICSLFYSEQTKAQCSTSYTPYQDCSWGDAIDAFSLAGVSSTGNFGCGHYYGYISYNTPVRNLTLGQSYPWTATAGTSGSITYMEAVAIWIDLNGNGQYESSEMLANSGAKNSHTGSITIPLTATAGNNRRMRVRCAYSGTSNTIIFAGSDACTDYMGSGYGETEDYYVNICAPVSIVKHPAPASACANGTAQFSVQATNAATYRWQVNTGAGFTNLNNDAVHSGVVTATLNMTGIPSTSNQYQYRCVITSTCGTPANSNAATLTLTDPTAINQQSASGNYCDGIPTELYIKTMGGPATGFEWQVDRGTGFVPLQNNNPFIGSDNDTLYILPLGDTMNGFVFRCVAIGVCGRDTSDNITINVEPVPSFTTDPVDVTVKEFSEAIFTVAAKGNANYRWQASSSNDNNFVNINDGSAYSGTLTTSLKVKNTSLAQTGYKFRCILAGTGNCGVSGDTTTTASLIVESTMDVKEVNKLSAITLYPNPATGNEVIITVDNKYTTGTLEVRIADKAGRMVHTGDITVSSAKTASLNIGKLPPGVYNVTVSDKDQSFTETVKLVKQ